MTLTIAIFALLAGILIGLLGAVLFIVAAVGFALIVLLPVLFFTTATGVFVWLWGLGTYYVIKWFNEKEVPGVHTDLVDGVKKQSGMSDLPGMNGESVMGNEEGNGEGDDREERQGAKETTKAPEQPKRRQQDTSSQGKSTGAQHSGHHADGQENSPSTTHPRKTANKSTNNDVSASEKANDTPAPKKGPV
jgi:hypothetical protein